MSLLPSTSHTCAPLALLTKNGLPPTARNARTGELTPPGINFSASAKSLSDLACPMGGILNSGLEPDGNIFRVNLPAHSSRLNAHLFWQCSKSTVDFIFWPDSVG